MAKQFDYDLIVIGAGPGGYVAAIRAAQLGMKTVVIEKDRPGGVCYNHGCIPSKLLIHYASMYKSLKEMEEIGVRVDRSGLDFGKLLHKAKSAGHLLSLRVENLFAQNKIDLIFSTATIKYANAVSLSNGSTLNGRFILIATGSNSREIPGFPVDEQRVLSSNGVMMHDQLPKSILILGTGAIGLEFAYMYNCFGVKVQMVELRERIIPHGDEDIALFLMNCFTKQSIEFMTNTKPISCDKKDDKVYVHLESLAEGSKTVCVDKVLVALGRTPNTQRIGLENVGIQVDRYGFIPVGDFYQTKIPSIYAVGDVVDTPQLAHVASREGEIAVEHIAGYYNAVARIDKDLIPKAVYCEPQYATFGYTEGMAKREGLKYEKVYFPYKNVGKSIIINRTEGIIKVLYDPDTRKIIGAHIVGAEASELIHELLLAKYIDTLPTYISTMIHAHPTLSETIMETMRMVEGWAIQTDEQVWFEKYHF